MNFWKSWVNPLFLIMGRRKKKGRSLLSILHQLRKEDSKESVRIKPLGSGSKLRGKAPDRTTPRKLSHPVSRILSDDLTVLRGNISSQRRHVTSDGSGPSSSSADPPRYIGTSPFITGPDDSLGECVAVDCEMVGTGLKGCVSMLGRCAVVNHHGHVLLDTMVAPLAPVTDYRTPFSGIRRNDLLQAPSFERVQAKVLSLLSGRTLVGHDIHHDLEVLDISHPQQDIRDTSKYTFCPFEKNSGAARSKLKTMFMRQTGYEIQRGEHCPIEDARAAMVLYQRNMAAWEASLGNL